jgi:hypothetical protein
VGGRGEEAVPPRTEDRTQSHEGAAEVVVTILGVALRPEVGGEPFPLHLAGLAQGEEGEEMLLFAGTQGRQGSVAEADIEWPQQSNL